MKKREIDSNTLLLLITIVLFIVMYGAGCVIYASKGFTHLQTFLNVLINNAGLLCVACGMTCVMLTGGIDISVGSLVALDCMLLAYGMGEWHLSAPWAWSSAWSRATAWAIWRSSPSSCPWRACSSPGA